MTNIDLSEVCGQASDTSWTPIGADEENPFTGIFDGGGHTVSNLYISSSENPYAGLFGFVEGGTVKNLSVSGTITNGWCIGGVVGMIQNTAAVTNCASSVKISTDSGTRYAGGVVGRNNSGSTVENCYNTGTVDVTGDSVIDPETNGHVSVSVGGVVGDNSGAVDNCYYLKDAADKGSGTDTVPAEEEMEKTNEQFASGEVAELLQSGQTDGAQVWGQKLPDLGGAPELLTFIDEEERENYKVLMVAFAGEEIEIAPVYTNKGQTIDEPDTPIRPRRSSTFSDVNGGTWYADAVIWAADNGIVLGNGNGQFSPNDPITREQLAVMLYRYARSRGNGFSGDWMFDLDFTDTADISNWAYEAIC